eukprot:1178395-Prorocentrum_minimum.AAC.4
MVTPPSARWRSACWPPSASPTALTLSRSAESSPPSSPKRRGYASPRANPRLHHPLPPRPLASVPPLFVSARSLAVEVK